MCLTENIESKKSFSKLFSLLFALISKHRLLRGLEVQERKPLSWNKPHQCVEELSADFQKRRFCFSIKPTPFLGGVYLTIVINNNNVSMATSFYNTLLVVFGNHVRSEMLHS